MLKKRPPKKLDQVCVIPFRWTGADWEFCLITSIQKKRWIFPKGIVDPGETPNECGLKEAWEEAGLEGEIVGTKVGSYMDEKWGCQLNVRVLLMEVTDEAHRWPEDGDREKRWLSLKQACQTVHKRALRKLLKKIDKNQLHQAAVSRSASE